MLAYAVTKTLTIFGADKCHPTFFGIPSWNKYLKLDSNTCQVTDFKVPGDLILVVLAVVDMLLTLAGLVAVVFVIYGGVRYATSQGNPEELKKAQSTLLNAIVGLLIAVVAIAIVSFLGNNISG